MSEVTGVGFAVLCLGTTIDNGGMSERSIVVSSNIPNPINRLR